MDTKLQIQQLVKELSGRFGTPTTLVEIQEMEVELNLEFPKEYKEFLQTFGWIDSVQEIFGGGRNIPKEFSIVEETLSLRSDYPDTFPRNVIAVYHDGRGNYDCIVCSGQDTGKVIFWQHDVNPDERYPKHPEGKPDFWLEGPDFWTWLLEMLQMTKEAGEEYEKGERTK